MTPKHDALCGRQYARGVDDPSDCDCDRIQRAVLRTARECIEIVHSAMLPRLRDEDGTEYVARDPLAAEIRSHALRVAGPLS
jgi:hypothetical protein